MEYRRLCQDRGWWDGTTTLFGPPSFPYPQRDHDSSRQKRALLRNSWHWMTRNSGTHRLGWVQNYQASFVTSSELNPAGGLAPTESDFYLPKNASCIAENGSFHVVRNEIPLSMPDKISFSCPLRTCKILTGNNFSGIQCTLHCKWHCLKNEFVRVELYSCH